MNYPLPIHSLRLALLVTSLSALSALTACSTARSVGSSISEAISRAENRTETTSDGTSTARTLTAYKEDLAQRITETNSTKVYPGHPQALLRAVVVVKFSVDAGGKLLHSGIVRGNRDSATENTVLASLRNTSPFPKPSAGLLRNGKVDITETFLFNNDGRYQIRSIAQSQMSE